MVMVRWWWWTWTWGTWAWWTWTWWTLTWWKWTLWTWTSCLCIISGDEGDEGDEGVLAQAVMQQSAIVPRLPTLNRCHDKINNHEKNISVMMWQINLKFYPPTLYLIWSQQPVMEEEFKSNVKFNRWEIFIGRFWEIHSRCSFFGEFGITWRYWGQSNDGNIIIIIMERYS